MRRRGDAARGLVAASVVALGVGLLVYGGFFREVEVTVDPDEADDTPVSPWSPREDLVVRAPHVNTPTSRQAFWPLRWVDEMTVPEPSMVFGVTIGALVRLDTGEIRMLRILKGADFCPS